MSVTKALLCTLLVLIAVWLMIVAINSKDDIQPLPSLDRAEAGATPVPAPIARPPMTNLKVPLLRALDGKLSVVVNASVSPPKVFEIGSLDSDGMLDVGTAAHVYIEVGTNDEPEMGAMVRDDPTARLIAFEPQPPVFAAMLQKFRNRGRLIPIPAAIAPTEAFTTIHVSEHRGCTSLLPMNHRASTFARKAKEKAPKKGLRIQLRTIEFCTSQSHTIEIPTFPLSKLLDRVPPKLPITVLMTDAQGFDTVVLSTLKLEHAERVRFLVTECQDLEPGHQLFLVNGAPSCHQQRRCIERWFPHRLDFCWDNAPKVRELNCIYRHPVHAPPSVKLPAKMKLVGGAKNLSYEMDGAYQCPQLL